MQEQGALTLRESKSRAAEVYETLYLGESSAGLLVPIGEERGDKLQYFSISSYRKRTFSLHSEHWWGNQLYVNLKLSFKIFPLSSPPAL